MILWKSCLILSIISHYIIEISSVITIILYCIIKSLLGYQKIQVVNKILHDIIQILLGISKIFSGTIETWYCPNLKRCLHNHIRYLPNLT